MKTEASQLESAGAEMYCLAADLFPLCRSLTGPGVRETLHRLQQHIPILVREVPTGTPVFDWEVPPEWTIRDAFIARSDGSRVVDFQKSNLHVVNGSQGFAAQLPWSRLKDHLHTLPDQPDLIPYRTCFHQDTWGFCLSHSAYLRLEAAGEQQYDVRIDATLAPGSLSYGEVYLPGESEEEVLLTTHVCHPSLANDNLSGIAVATYVGKWLQEAPRRYSYRLLFLPATIGAITWLSLHEHQLERIRYGLILALLGDAGGWTFKKCRRESAEINRVVSHVLSTSGDPFSIRDFEPYGYDERQFCSPGFDLPMGCLMRSANGEFPEYHTSADNLDFIQPEYLGASLKKVIEIVEVIEGNRIYMNQNPKCEPRLGRRGLYQSFGCGDTQRHLQQAVLWVLSLSDGDSSLLDIAERSGRPFTDIVEAATALRQCDLLREHQPDGQCEATVG